MMTQIIHGNPNQISEMQKTLSMISMTLTPLPHVPSPLIPQISFCSSKSSWSHLPKSTRVTFLLIAWKSIFRRGVVLQSHPKGLHLNRLSQFFSSPYLIASDFKPWGDSLRELTYLTPFTISQTCVCLMANLVLLNLTLSLTVHFHAVHGYSATYMCITHVLCFSSILPPPCSYIMPLISAMPALDSISRFNTNIYIQYDSI